MGCVVTHIAAVVEVVKVDYWCVRHVLVSALVLFSSVVQFVVWCSTAGRFLVPGIAGRLLGQYSGTVSFPRRRLLLRVVRRVV